MLARLAANRILETLQKTAPVTAADYIERYTAGPEPWCQLDTDHRALERLALNFDLDPWARTPASKNFWPALASNTPTP